MNMSNKRKWSQSSIDQSALSCSRLITLESWSLGGAGGSLDHLGRHNCNLCNPKEIGKTSTCFFHVFFMCFFCSRDIHPQELEDVRRNFWGGPILIFKEFAAADCVGFFSGGKHVVATRR